MSFEEYFRNLNNYEEFEDENIVFAEGN